MISTIVRTIAASALITVYCSTCLGAAPATTTKNEILRLLATGEKITPSAVADAKALYEKLRADSRGDQKVELAYGAVLVQQRRYREARKQLARYLDANPEDDQARLLKIRAALGDHRPAEVFDDADGLASRLAAPSGKIPNDERNEWARQLGVVFGYLELAHPDQTQAERRLASRNRLLKALDKEESTTFDAGRTETAELVAKLDAELEAERRRIERFEKHEAEVIQSALDNAKEKLVDQNDVVQSSQDAASEAEREAGVLAMQLANLRDDRARVGARFAALQAQIQSLTTSTYSYTDQTTPGSRNPIGTSTTTSTTVPVDRMIQANALAFQLAAVNKQAIDMDRKIFALQNRLAEVAEEHAKNKKNLADTDAEGRELERKAKIAEKKLKRKPRTSNARITALRAELANFSTYLPFDFEAEKQRVLKMFDQ